MSIYENYQILERIGRICKIKLDGSSCTVRKAIRRDTRQVFALKLYQTNFLKAKNQIDLLIRLDHPSIVNIYDVFEDESNIILVLEYMAGGELFDKVGQKSRLTEGEVKQYLKVAVDAVRYCHEIGIVHRDIKPQNLLLSSNGPDGILKLADFGISKIFSDQILTTNCGTPVYMAPEIWAGKGYNEKVDIWSIGILMFYLLSGEYPFLSEESELGNKIINQEISFQGQVWSVISSKATDLLRSLLKKNPADRPSASQISTHLWFSHVDPIYKEIQEVIQVNLYQAVHKIRRHIFKSRHRKMIKTMKQIGKASILNKAHLKFLCYEETSESTEESKGIEDQLMQIQF